MRGRKKKGYLLSVWKFTQECKLCSVCDTLRHPKVLSKVSKEYTKNRALVPRAPPSRHLKFPPLALPLPVHGKETKITLLYYACTLFIKVSTLSHGHIHITYTHYTHTHFLFLFHSFMGLNTPVYLCHEKGTQRCLWIRRCLEAQIQFLKQKVRFLHSRDLYQYVGSFTIK